MSRVSFLLRPSLRRCFSASATRRLIRDIAELPPRVHPRFQETSSHDLLALRWPSPPRNVLIVRKDDDAAVAEALHEYACHIHDAYPETSLILEPHVARQVHEALPFPVYTVPVGQSTRAYQDKVDLTTTLGGDGTILHAASLFATTASVPPVLSFSMGTLGFLGEWKFREYKRAFREVYMSGAPTSLRDNENDGSSGESAAERWTASARGKSMGASRTSRILLRNRLRVGIYSETGERLPHGDADGDGAAVGTDADVFALNEVLIHRGQLPHLAHITILIGSPPRNQRTLTTAIADGFLVSTPTGSTAYSLSSGGSIVHPLVDSLLLTPICPRSLSFRPLVLPANTPVTLRIEPSAARARELEVSIDGVRRPHALKPGMEVRVVGEEAVRSVDAPSDAASPRSWSRGVPSIVRSGGGSAAADAGDDHWVGGLNSLLKFNYPFGEDG